MNWTDSSGYFFLLFISGHSDIMYSIASFPILWNTSILKVLLRVLINYCSMIIQILFNTVISIWKVLIYGSLQILFFPLFLSFLQSWRLMMVISIVKIIDLEIQNVILIACWLDRPPAFIFGAGRPARLLALIQSFLFFKKLNFKCLQNKCKAFC